MASSEEGITLVLDIGKTRSKVLAIAADGKVVGSWARPSASLKTNLGYMALDSHGTEDWLHATLAGLGEMRRAVRRIVPITHGAAFAGIDAQGLVMPVADYEFRGFDERAEAWEATLDPTEATLSPSLPLGLNAAVQLDWLERHLPRRFAAVQQWLPYPQYWAWRLCGVASSEITSLGCHTQLWRPRGATWSDLAQRRGWAARFAPLRRAWEPLGFIDPGLAQRLGLPRGISVHCGAHDSNACLARYLRAMPSMTVVSTGTWTVVMAPGASRLATQATADTLGNISVRGEIVPTARAMGGRQFEAICAGAQPKLASTEALQQLKAAGVCVSADGESVRIGPDREVPIDYIDSVLDESKRASLAASHAAHQTAKLIRELQGSGPVIVEGPFSTNPLFLDELAAEVKELQVSIDPLEGTARGGWLLGRWTSPEATPPLVREHPAPLR